MNRSKPNLYTTRALLRLPNLEDAPKILQFYQENRDHFAPWNATPPVDFFTENYWRKRIEGEIRAFENETAVRLYVFLKTEPERVVGFVGFSNLVRGVAQYCNLGYGIDFREQGKGLMTESALAGIEYLFEDLNLHRIIASYLPRNLASAAVLKRLGFEIEGHCKEMLRIDGKWEDHIQTALINPNWRVEG